MKYYAVIDTNVVVSFLWKDNSVPGEIIKLIFKDKIVPILNEEIINEYYDVLTRNKFRFSQNKVERILSKIKSKGIFLERKQKLEEFIDSDDIVFYEIVMSARCTMDAYLVTGNIKHYPIRNYVVTPRQMLDIIESEKELEKKNNNKSA